MWLVWKHLIGHLIPNAVAVMHMTKGTYRRVLAKVFCTTAVVVLFSVHASTALSETVQDLEQRLQVLLVEKRQHASDPTVLVTLADLYLDLGDAAYGDTAKRRTAYEEGARVARQALDLQEQNAQAHYLYAANLGSAAQLKGTMASALIVQDLKTHVRRALEIQEDHAPALHMMGMMLEELPWFLGGDADAALTYLKRATVADPSYVHARLDLAKAYVKRRALDEARRELRILLDSTQSADLSIGKRRYRREAADLLGTLSSR